MRTRLPIIIKEVELETIIHNDKWKTYFNLNQLDFIYKTINHSTNCINPQTGVYIQHIEYFYSVLQNKNVISE